MKNSAWQDAPIWPEYWQLSYAQIRLAGQSLLERNEQLAKEFALELEPLPIWLCRVDLEQAQSAQAAQLHDAQGQVLARFLNSNTEGGNFQAQHSRALRYPWDLLHAHEQALAEWSLNPWVASQAQVLRPEDLPAGVHASAPVHLGQGSRILPGVVLEGPVWVGEDCRIGPHAYLRGPIQLGDSCTVGHAVELKNVLMGDCSAVAHLSYVGDSVLGQQVNFGAGSMVANFRHDGQNHHSLWCGEKLDTGRRKFGSIVGDQVRLGINTSIYPGRKLSQGSYTLPAEALSEDRFA